MGCSVVRGYSNPCLFSQARESSREGVWGWIWGEGGIRDSFRFFSQWPRQSIMPVLVGLGAVFFAFHLMAIFVVSCFSFIFIAPQHDYMALNAAVIPAQSNTGN